MVIKDQSQATSKIEGINDREVKILQATLLFLRSVKPFEVAEIKLADNDPHRLSFHVRTNYKQTFDL